MRTPPFAALLTTAVAAAALSGAGCQSKPDPAPVELAGDNTRPAPAHLLGVSPLDFRCAMVAPLDQVSQVLGVAVEQVPAGFAPPAGVPPPCNYRSTVADHPGDWSFDIDCRDHALQDGARLMAGFAVEAGAVPVRVGRSGLDHHGVQLLFIDDDAPCYVRVMGPDAASRLALARLVADRLDPHTAPGRVTFHK